MIFQSSIAFDLTSDLCGREVGEQGKVSSLDKMGANQSTRKITVVNDEVRNIFFENNSCVGLKACLRRLQESSRSLTQSSNV